MATQPSSSLLHDSDRIDSWKSIASFFGRDERTVKRWEKERALPVHRVPGKRGGVFAYRQDLSRWLNSATHDRRIAHLFAAPSLSADPATSPSETFSYESFPITTAGSPVAGHQSNSKSSSESTSGTVSHAGNDPTPQIAAGFQIGPTAMASEFKSNAGNRSQRWPIPAAAIAACGAVILIASFWSSSRSGIAARQSQTLASQYPALASQSSANRPAVDQAAAAHPADRLVLNQSKVMYSSNIAGVDELYLQGVYLYEQRTPDSVRHALRNFQEAIAKDPNYAPAYAGLANSYNLSREYLLAPPAEAFPKAIAAAQKAISLDPSLAQAHSALGFAEFFGSWQASAAEREFRTAIALEPNAGLPHLWYGSMLTHEARYPEAIEQLNLAYRLQPSSTAILSSRALAIGLSGHRNEGADLLQQIINEDRNAPAAHLRLAMLSLVEPRDISRFIEEDRRRAELSHDKTLLNFVTVNGRVYRNSGEPAMWQSILREERKQHPSQITWLMAQSETALGHNDAAIADLEVLRKQHDYSMVAIEMDPVLRPLHHDQRFQHIVSAIGLPVEN